MTGVIAAAALALSSGGELTLAQQIERVSCEDGFDADALEALLADEASMSIEGTREVVTGFSSASARVGCASYVESADKRMRIWLLKLSSEGRYLEPVRGYGAIQWRDDDGTVSVAMDGTPDLSLDGFSDGVHPLPGTKGEWLITGLKWKGTWRRWAQVISAEEGFWKPKKGFARAKATREALLLDAPPPESGKMRHSPLWNRWLRFDAKSGELALEDVPNAPSKKGRQVVAVWKNGRFEIRGTTWGEIRLVSECDCP